ncbi:MAG: DsbA family protein [Rhizomicrobium sp.]
MTLSFRTALAAGLLGALIALSGAYGAMRLGWVSVANGPAIRDYLLTHPEVLVEASNKLQARQDASEDASRQTAIDKLGSKALFDSRLAFITGPARAKTTFVEFFDYNCPYCRASVPAVKKFYETHKDARFAFIEFPIKGAQSTFAARAAVAARKQPDKYLAFHFALMNEAAIVDENLVYADAQKAGLDVAKLKSDMRSPEVDAALVASHKLAEAIGIDGTPAFVIDGKMREGGIDDETLEQMTKS